MHAVAEDVEAPQSMESGYCAQCCVSGVRGPCESNVQRAVPWLRIVWVLCHGQLATHGYG